MDAAKVWEWRVSENHRVGGSCNIALCINPLPGRFRRTMAPERTSRKNILLQSVPCPPVMEKTFLPPATAHLSTDDERSQPSTRSG